jgi:hypothetical protein
MIDDPEKTDGLMKMLKLALPIQANIPQSLGRSLAKRSPQIPIPGQCNVIDVVYSGDEGGIVCCLDIGGANTAVAHVVSITHLTFNRNTPLAREIEAYQRHRNKKLKRQQGRVQGARR